MLQLLSPSPETKPRSVFVGPALAAESKAPAVAESHDLVEAAPQRGKMSVAAICGLSLAAVAAAGAALVFLPVVLVSLLLFLPALLPLLLVIGGVALTASK
jgi:hypothetical protein